MKRTTLTLIFTWLFSMILNSSLEAQEAPKICITMIVKNESKIIERCLDSVKGIADCISIVDTGSTDHTVQTIENYMQKHNILGKVHHHEWKNFGHNRTLSVEAAQSTIKELGFNPDKTYLLLIDADMLLEIGKGFKKENLISDHYMVSQKNQIMAYYNTRLIKASLPWKCVGVTHEYWASSKAVGQERLMTLSIDDRDDGGCKADKYERDIRLLTKGLEEEPDNERYMFYLGQSYKSIDRHEESIYWYQKRVEKGGWPEEVWYSKYMIGQSYQALGQWDKAAQAFLDAFQTNPTRAEPLYDLSSYYISKGDYELGLHFAKWGLSIPYPVNDCLFISYPVYDFLLEQNVSIAAYYTSKKYEGFQAVNNLMLKKGIPDYIKERARLNLLFYVEPLADAVYQAVDINPPLIREGLSARFNPMNPSILKTKNGFSLICRTVNYFQSSGKCYHYLDLLDANKIIRTRNFLMEYDKDFNVLSQKEIVENLNRPKREYRPIQGLEDCRLFEFNGEKYFSCTTLDTSPTGMPQISVCKLAAASTVNKVSVLSLTALAGPNLNRCEKNWMPFVKNNELHMIYSYDPYIVYKPKLQPSGDTPISNEVLERYAIQKKDLSRFLGSAPPIAYNDGYLMLIHEVVFDNERFYFHRFLYLDKDYNIKKASKPFTFIHKGIEYCCGIATDHDNKNVVLSIGVEDREAYLCHVGTAVVDNMLESLD